MDPTSLLTNCMNRQIVTTPLGPMLAIADDDALLLLEFTSRPDLDDQVKTLTQLDPRSVVEGSNSILVRTRNELDAYFAGELVNFSLPIKIQGTNFQETVWQELQRIPYGETISYQELGKRIGNDQAARAVGSANGQNRLAIVIPCHRVIRADGSIGGYAGGAEQKQWLLDHESRFKSKS